MRRLIMCIMLACIMFAGTPAAATFVPTNVVCENRVGRQLIIKTFTLSADDSPDSLVEETFTQEGYSYSFISIVKEEKPFENKKAHSDTVKVETKSKDLSAILNALEPAIQYDHGEYSGSLTLDHTTLNTEVTDYSTKNYTVSETKTIEGLERNDPSYIPRTTVKDGHTLSLQNVDWAV